MRYHELIAELNIDNRTGWGTTPNNTDVDYFGLRVKVLPETFLDLAAKLRVGAEERKGIEAIKAHTRSGGGVASPSFTIVVPNEWREEDFSGKIPRIQSHEGRHRMNAQLELNGNIPTETHLFLSSPNKEWRTRYITPAIIEQLNKVVESEGGYTVRGPWFSI